MRPHDPPVGAASGGVPLARVTERTRRNDPSAFTKHLEPKTDRAPVEEQSSSLLTLQRSAGNNAVVSMLGLDAPAAAPATPDHTIHRFYVEWDGETGPPDGQFTDTVTGKKHSYKWLPGTRDESLYEESDKKTGWYARNLYKKKPGAVATPAPEEDDDSGPEVEQSFTASGKGKTEAPVIAKGDAGTKPEKEATPSDDGLGEVEVSMDIAEGKFKKDAVDLLGKKYKASGTGSVAISSGGGLSGEGSLTAERDTGAKKSTISLDGIETALKSTESSEKLGAKGALDMNEMSAEVSQATAGASSSATSTYASGASTSSSTTTDATAKKATASLGEEGLSASYSSSKTAMAGSVGADAGNVLGDNTSLKGKADASALSTGQATKGKAGGGEASVEHSRTADLAKVGGEIASSYTSGETAVSGKVTGSAGLGASAKASAKGTYDSETGDVAASGEMSAFAGGTAETSATVAIKVSDKDLASFKGTMGITYGLGGAVSGGMSWKGGAFSWHASGKLSAGLGTSFSYKVELDTIQVATLIADKAWSYVPSLDLFGFGDLQIDLS